LVPRRNHVYKSFQKLAAWLGENVQVLDAVIDGELVCLGADGRPQFDQLLYRRGDPYFYSFDLLWLNGEDLRKEPLLEHKRLLKEIIPEQPSRLLFASHQEGSCKELFRAACKADLEGLIAKWKFGTYTAGDITSWVKIKNPAYTQTRDRHEQFTRFRHLALS
jgi:bifunctional non-homologous end joining protein LigD